MIKRIVTHLINDDTKGFDRDKKELDHFPAASHFFNRLRGLKEGRPYFLFQDNYAIAFNSRVSRDERAFDALPGVFRTPTGFSLVEIKAIKLEKGQTIMQHPIYNPFKEKLSERVHKELSDFLEKLDKEVERRDKPNAMKKGCILM